MILEFSFYFLTCVLSLVWFYIVGFFVFKMVRINFSNEETNGLANLLLGISLHVILFSIYKTHFATFNVLLALLLLFILLEYHRGKPGIRVSPVNIKMHLVKILELIGVALFFLLLRIFTVTDTAIYPFFHGGRDDIFYSQVSSFISKQGVESCYVDWVNQPSSLGLIPYHYFELWLNAIIVDITGFLSLTAYYFVTATLISVCLYQTIVMIASIVLQQSLTLKNKLLALALIFIGNLFFGFFTGENWPNLSGAFSIYDNYKIILVFIVFSISWVKWKDSQYVVSLLVLLIIPIINYGLMPVIICAVPVFFAVHKWIFKMPEKIPYGRILLYYGTYAVLLSEIQKVFPNKFEGGAILGLNELIGYYNELAKVKTLINFAFNYTLKICSLFVPFILIILPLKKYGWLHIKDGFVLLMTLILLSALALSSILYFVADTSQIFTIAFNTILHLFLFIGIFLLFFKVEKYFFLKALIGIYLLSGIYMLASSMTHKQSIMNRYSSAFLKKVASVSGDIHGQGVRYLTPDYYKSAYNLDPNCNFEGYFLSFLKNDVIIHTVTVNQIPDKQELHDFFNYNKQLALAASYYLHAVDKAGLSTVSDEAAQLRFIKDHPIDFIVTTKDAKVPSSINKLVYKELVDSFSGERLMLIDRKKIPN
jgi:hypothetical protein